MNHREIQIRKRLNGRIKFVDGPFDLKEQLAEIGTGVLFIRANWSGQCSASFSVFCNAVSQTPAGTFAAHVVDNDQCNPAECSEVLGEVSHGYGESFWIKSGAVVYADRGYHNGPLTRILKTRIKEFAGIDVQVPGDGNENAFEAMVMRNCQGLAPALIEIYDLEFREISDLDLAVVTLYHPNHAISITTVRALAKALTEVADPRIRLIVLYSDAVSLQEMRRTYGEGPRSGMTYWICKGKIIATDRGYGKGEIPLKRVRDLQRKG
ncbi:MAG: hypothetical protein K2X77_06290 [Candidatus Obscuribacterales bacterium]|jgi:hypothetical protein|nr:hypothetical protein [Candidatus Obscuribacterales bacterium]